MPLKIFNSQTQQKEEFTPLEKGVVKIYACGPTVYDEPHIGHLRSAYVFEVVRNYFKYTGHKVRFARNVTDVDDKIIDKARESGLPDLNGETKKVAEKYFDLYKRDLKKLGIQDPDFEPKATQFIPQMIKMIELLIDRKNAYVINGDVYFEVNTFGAYGEISHQQTDQMLEQMRIEPNPNKKTPFDFALWKQAKEGEPSWDSPWGKGRPGWHIECSAMSMNLFNNAFDIHGGGRDLIFPHHENENAQSKCANTKDEAGFVRAWMHHGLITVEGKKMSKSLKNYTTLDAILKSEPAFADEVLKLTFLGTQYGAPLDYSQERVRMDQAVWRKFYEFFQNARQLELEGHKLSEKRLPEVYVKFREAMDNDFNTPEVLSVMHGLMSEVYKQNDPIYQLTVAAAIRNFGAEVFAINFDQDHRSNLIKSEIESFIEKRAAAKKTKDFKTADAIRQRLLEENKVELRDLSDGRTTWRVRL